VIKTDDLLMTDMSMGKGNAEVLEEAGRPRSSTTDEAELEKFREIAERWWDVAGPMAPLHRLNPVRIDWIVERTCAAFARPRQDRTPLAGLRVLDVGCGGGLLAEPLRRLGAEVTAIDAEPATIDVARRHAAESGLAIDYRATTVEALAAGGERFDVVTALEVIEHVSEPEILVESLAAVTKPGGLVVMSTISRTAAGFLLGIVAAEYVLRWLPRGTHRWSKFLKPAELTRLLRAAGLRPTGLTGIAWNPGYQRFERTRNVDVNYMLAAVRG